MTRGSTQLVHVSILTLSLFPKKEADSLDISLTDQLALGPPLADREKADAALHYGAPNSRCVLPAFAS